MPESQLSPEILVNPALRGLVARGVQRRYRKGALLIQEGEFGDTVFVVLQGRLRAYVSDARGREVTLAYHGVGDYVGEMSLDGQPRSASVEAYEATTCIIVTLDSVWQQLACEPAFCRELVLRLIGRSRLATDSTRSLALLDVYSRLRRFLELRAEMLGDGTRQIKNRLTHQAIANEIGCSREMVSRVMKDLENGGYVRIHERGLLLTRELPNHW